MPSGGPPSPSRRTRCGGALRDRTRSGTRATAPASRAPPQRAAPLLGTACADPRCAAAGLPRGWLAAGLAWAFHVAFDRAIGLTPARHSTASSEAATHERDAPNPLYRHRASSYGMCCCREIGRGEPVRRAGEAQAAARGWPRRQTHVAGDASNDRPRTRAAVWRWLVQMGYPTHRAGWYTPYWMDRPILGIRAHSADHIVPELQSLSPGDRVPDSRMRRWRTSRWQRSRPTRRWS